MRGDNPFRKSFACAGILFVLLVSFVAFTDAKGLRNAVAIFSGVCVLLAVVTGTWAFFSKKAWPWSRFALTTVGLFFAYVIAFFVIMAAVAGLTQER